MSDTPKKDEVQGEGDYEAARRYDKDVQSFSKEQVEQAKKDAAPKTPQEAEEMKRAEEIGKSHSKGEGSLESQKNPPKP